MDWSRISLETYVAGRRSPDFLAQYVLMIPVMSDGRIASHELVGNELCARVERWSQRQGTVTGALYLEDSQYIIHWHDSPAFSPPPVRLCGESFCKGAVVALRPGAGPAELYEVMECEPIASASRTIELIGNTSPAD